MPKLHFKMHCDQMYCCIVHSVYFRAVRGPPNSQIPPVLLIHIIKYIAIKYVYIQRFISKFWPTILLS